eukprot:COSAG06_NODE_12550_length_1365_cov_0.775671_1_plen_72_part_10
MYVRSKYSGRHTHPAAPAPTVYLWWTCRVVADGCARSLSLPLVLILCLQSDLQKKKTGAIDFWNKSRIGAVS